MSLSSIGVHFRHLSHLIVRRKRPVIFGDTARSAPVSRQFGFDRGTPIDRHYIARFLSGHAAELKGACLEVGGTKYLDIFAQPGAEKVALATYNPAAKSGIQRPGMLVGDLISTETLPEGRFDNFVCVQTLPFIYDFRAAIRSAHAMLKFGGCFLGTVGGVSQVSRYDMDRWGDYWRFTSLSLRRVLEEIFPAVQIEIYGNSLAAQLSIQGVAVEDLSDPAVLDEVDEDFQVILGFLARKA